MSNKKFFIPFFIVFISIIPLLDLFHPGMPLTHDGQDHVARIANFYQNLSEGNIIPRWAGNLNWGYGHPILMFLYPLPSYAASLFHFLGLSLIDSTKIVFGIAFLLSGLTMYLWIKNILGIHAGVIAGILYMFAPYRLVDLYVRGAVGEHVAFVFIPLIFYFLLKLSRKVKFAYVVGGSFSLAALILSHNAITLMFFPLIFFYAICLIVFPTFASEESRLKTYHLRGVAKRLLGGERKKLFAFVYVILLGFGLSSFFLLPAFFEGKYTLRDIVTAKEYASRFTDFTQFIYGQWSYGGSDQLSKQVGIAQLILTIVSLPIAIFFYKKKNNKWRVMAVLFLIFWLTIFLMTPLSKLVWDKLTVLQKFQFPWRFLSVVVFSTSVLGALVVSAIPKNYKKYAVGIVIFMILFFSKDYMHAKGYLYKVDSFFGGIYNGTTDTGESSPIWSVRFMEKRPKEHMEVANGKATIKQISRKSTVHVYEINSAEKSRIVENTLYFPGWNVYADGRKTEIEFQDPRYRGLMTFFVDKGKHNVEIKFGETKLRLFADIISIISVLCILGFLGFNILKNKI